MATITLEGATLGGPLQELLMADDIVPGAEPSYALCQAIYVYHPLGKKLCDTPITLAQSQPREIAIPGAPDRVKEKFLEQWKSDGCDGHIFNVASASRRLGVAAVGVVAESMPPAEPLDFDKLAGAEISFNVWDALNLAGSQVLDLDPNSVTFLKPVKITVAGTPYHRSRGIVLMHEKPVYLKYSNSAYGFTGRSVYQRGLFPLKSFILTMVTDAMVARKAGLLIAKMKQAGSIVTAAMQKLFSIKRGMLEDGATNNVLGVSVGEEIDSLNLQNVNGAMSESRKNILDNIATSADMPAIILNQETFAEGFGEGIEDAKSVARYIGGVRAELDPVYEWFNVIVMHRAWTPEFFKTLQAEEADSDAAPYYAEMDYRAAFYQWKNSFSAIWPSLIEEPESEAVQVEDVKLKGVIAIVQVAEPMMPDQLNKAALLSFLQDTVNSMSVLFRSKLDLDFDAIASYEPPTPIAMPDEDEGEGKEPSEPKPFSRQDAAARLDAWIAERPDLIPPRKKLRAAA
jgi:hypothetical protein